MQNMSIVHIVQSEGAGVTEYIKMLATKMDTNKYEISIIGSKYYECERNYFEKRNWNLITVDMEREIKIWKDIKAIIEIRHFLKNMKPSIIHIHSSKAGFLGRIAALGLNIKIIYNAHGWAFNMKQSNRKILLYKNVEKILSYFTDKIINISQNEYDSAVEVGISKKKMIVLKNAIEINNRKEYDTYFTRKELKIDQNAYIIGICGRITEQKSPEIFARICEKISKRISNAHFLIIGDGDLKHKVLEDFKEKGISEKLTITGWTSKPEKYIDILDIALLTSKWEGFGLVLLQYMIQKKPVIAAHVGGIPEIVRNGYSGITVLWDDVESYCHYIESIKSFPENYINIIDNAYNMVKMEYSLDNLIKYHEELYENISKNYPTF